MSNSTLAAPAALSHLVQAIVVSPQAARRGRTRWFPCGPTEAEARATIQRSFPSYTIESVKTKKAVPVKKSVNLVVKHDYITLSATYATGRINLTCSWGGNKMSGVAGTKAIWASFLAFVKHKAPAAAMAHLKTLAEGVNSAAELAAAMDAVPRATAAVATIEYVG